MNLRNFRIVYLSNISIYMMAIEDGFNIRRGIARFDSMDGGELFELSIHYHDVAFKMPTSLTKKDVFTINLTKSIDHLL